MRKRKVDRREENKGVEKGKKRERNEGNKEIEKEEIKNYLIDTRD